MSRKKIFAIAAALAFLLPPLQAEAGERVKLSITPYAWLMSVKGDVRAKGYTAHVDMPFTTLTKHINFAGMLAIEALVDDTWGFTGNINAAKLGESGSVRGVALDSASSMILSDMVLFYRLGRTPVNQSGSAYVVWDVLAGARLWDLRAKLDVNHPYRQFTVSQHETWVDPIIGGKAWLRLADKWGIEFRADYGGFGINSDHTWSASSILGYSLWNSGRLLLGYRAMGVDYETGSGTRKFTADAILHGPIVGIHFQF